MTAFEENHPHLTAVLGGLTAGLVFTTGFAPLSWNWASFAALAGWFFLVLRLRSVRDAALSGFAFGLGWFVPGLAWTMTSMAVHGRLPWAAAFAGLLLLGAVLSVFPAAAAASAKRLSSSSGQVRSLLSLAGCFAIAEWLRTEVIVGFGWLTPAYAFLETPIAGWAPILGSGGVTLVAAVSAALLVTAFECRLRWLALPVLILALIAGTGRWSSEHRWSTPSETVDIRVIQPALPVVNAYVRADPAARIEAMIPAASEPWPGGDRPRLLLTPEGIVSVPVGRLNARAAGALFALQEKSDAMVLFNGFREEKRRFYNSSFVIDEGRVAYRLDKRELVPFGEYVPAAARWFVDMIGIPLADLTPGDAVQPLLRLGRASAGILICYENLYGGVVRTFWQSTLPDFLIVTSNLGWFSDQILPQHLDMSRMRAMECARPLVSVSNSGMSAVVNSSGRVVKSLGVGEAGVMTLGLVGAQGAMTPFVRFGAAPGVILAFLLVFNALFSAGGLKRLKEISGKRL